MNKSRKIIGNSKHRGVLKIDSTFSIVSTSSRFLSVSFKAKTTSDEVPLKTDPKRKAGTKSKLKIILATRPKRIVLKITPIRARLVEIPENRLKTWKFKLNEPVNTTIISASVLKKSGTTPITETSIGATLIYANMVGCVQIVGPSTNPTSSKKKMSGNLAFFNTLATMTPIPKRNAKYVKIKTWSDITHQRIICFPLFKHTLRGCHGIARHGELHTQNGTPIAPQIELLDTTELSIGVRIRNSCLGTRSARCAAGCDNTNDRRADGAIGGKVYKCPAASSIDMGKDNAPKIDELISKIPENQIEILREIWEHFLKTKEWPKGRPFRKDRRSIVGKLIADLDPIFVRHYNKNNPAEEYYRLTTEGVYAGEGFEGASIKLIISYLDYLREKFAENQDIEGVTAQELRDKLQIDSEETRILGEFFDMGNTKLYGVRAGNLGTSDWTAGVLDDIEILYEEKSSQEFLLKQWNDYLERIITHNTGKTSGILGIQESQISETDKNKNTKIPTKVKKSEAEVERRESVLLARRLGTQIRKEMLIRHADTAKLNLPTVKKALRDIEEEEIRVGMGSIGEVMFPIMRENERKLMKCNDCIRTYNKIIEVLNNEGIYCVKMEELPVRGEIFSNIGMLKTAGDNLKQIVEFYQILEKCGEE